MKLYLVFFSAMWIIIFSEKTCQNLIYSNPRFSFIYCTCVLTSYRSRFSAGPIFIIRFQYFFVFSFFFVSTSSTDTTESAASEVLTRLEARYCSTFSSTAMLFSVFSEASVFFCICVRYSAGVI